MRVAVVAVGLGLLTLGAQQSRLRVASEPALILGSGESDSTQLFATVTGATRLPNGNLLVADRGSFSLHLYSPEGRHLKALGRRGSGPGEFRYLARLWRCGDSLLAWDIDGHLGSVLNLQAEFVRHFRFGSPEIGGQVPYTSACNAGGTFVHYGWGVGQDPKPPTYRPSVPFWTSRADPGITRELGRLPGSERHVHIHEGRVVGSGPLPLGRQTSLAIGSDRIYVGTAEQYEILVFDRNGGRLAPIRKPGAASAPVTRSDMDRVRDLALAAARPSARPAVEAAYAAMPFPKTLPPYHALQVDALDHLWVQDYPRPTSPTVTWTVFTPEGRLLGELALPRDLEVFEIGRDYVLGRYLDPEEAIPQVRLYRLTR